MTHLRVPTWATVALSVLAGVLSYLNLTSFGFAQPWQDLVTIGLCALAAIGIAPLTGPALQNAIHLSHAAALSIGSIITTATVAVTTLSISTDSKAVLTGLLAIAAGTLFGPAGPTPATGVAPAA